MHQTSTAMGKRRIYLILIFIFLSFNNLSAQSGWFQIPSPTNRDIYSVSFINKDTFFICTDSGRIYKTIDGDKSWKLINVANSSSWITKITFPSSTTGYLISEYPSKFYKTTDSGDNWFVIDITFPLNPKDIYFVNINTGYLSNFYNVLKTTNGGLTWDTTGYTADYRNLYGIFFNDEFTGFVGGVTQPTIFFIDGWIWKTTNGGMNWNFVFHTSDNIFIGGFSFINSMTGYACGSFGNIFKTTNGGDNWSTYILSNNPNLGSIYANNNTTAYTCGLRGLYKTSNSGTNWTNTNIQNKYYSEIIFINNDTGYVVGEDGIIFKTTTGGNTVDINLISNEVPEKISLSQNYPNPFNPQTKIRFAVPVNSNNALVNIKVYDIVGKEVAVIVNETLNDGEYEVTFNGNNLPSGIYFYSLNIDGQFIDSKKMMLIK